MLAALLRALMIGAAGAAGAVLVTVLASPLTPVGEARLADPSPGGMSVDPVVLPLGALAVLAAVTAVSAWPAVRHARLLSNRPPPGPAPALVHSAGRAAALAGLPATAVIGIRRALDRGRGGQPVGTALLGTVMAVAALCATAVFGASLTHLISTPALYGAPFQAYFSGDGEPGSAAVVSGPLLDGLRKDSAIEQITLAAFVEVTVNGSPVRAVAMTPLRGAALLSALDGRLPRGDRGIMLGVATMRATGARLGGTVRVTITDPAGAPHQASFRVIGRASLNAGTGGLGNGAVMTTGAFIGAQCPAGRGQPACQRAVRQGLAPQRFVAHLAHRLEGLAVLLMLTVREPRAGTAQQKSLIAGLAAEASVIALRPAALGAAACAELVSGRLGADPSPAFQYACRELTGGNPLLLRGLLASLAAEGVKGTDAEVPHLRRLTPSSVSRSVLLQLGRMPAAALAAARAVAVLGTAATPERAGRLTGLDGDSSAEAIGALMAERLIEARPGAAVRASPGAVCGLPGPGPAGAAALAQTRRPHAR